MTVEPAFEFFRTMYGDTHGDLVITTFPSGKSVHFPTAQIAQAAVYAIAQAGDQNVYFGVGLRNLDALKQRAEAERKDLSQIRGAADAVTVLPGVFFDLDRLGGTHKETALPTLEQAVNFLAGFELPPTVVTDSGGGFQPYWLLDKPWVFKDSSERAEAQELSKAFQEHIISEGRKRGWKFDNTSDIARILRVPGTTNRKGDPLPVTVSSSQPVRYSLADIKGFLARHAPAQAVAAEEVSDDAMVELLKPYYRKDHRNELTLAIAGFLAKEKMPYPTAKLIIEQLAVDDEEKRSRLEGLHRTYELLKAGEPVKGYMGLEEILTGGDLRRLTELVAEISIPPSIRRVDTLRSRRGPAHRTHREIADFVHGALAETGRFLMTSEPSFFYFDKARKRLIDVKGPQFGAMLCTAFGLNGVERLADYVREDIEARMRTAGATASVYRIAHYDTASQVLYVSLGGGSMAKLDGQQITICDNGTDDVIFTDEVDPVQPNLGAVSGLRKALLDGLNFSVLVPRDRQETLIWTWIRSLFFVELLPSRPILAVVGGTGAGKTMLSKKVLALLYGARRTNPDSVRTLDDFEISLSSCFILAYDNVDGSVEWLEDALAKASTGEIIRRRRLYAQEMIEFKPRCHLVITARTPQFRREDVSSRLIIVRLDTIPKGQKVSELALLQGVLGPNRHRLWGALLHELNDCVRWLRETPLKQDGMESRLADWEALGRCLNAKDGQEDAFMRAVQGMGDDSANFTVEEDPLVPYLVGIADETFQSAKTIWQKAEGAKGPFKSAISVAAHIINNEATYRQLFGLKVRQTRTKTKEYAFRLPDDAGAAGA